MQIKCNETTKSPSTNILSATSRKLEIFLKVYDLPEDKFIQHVRKIIL